eukprot:CAMPEP_0174852356 /NCGR_PEP_ID=MMETSP1114-20130205/25321_1 /TAXON_ID=312471 /ORGANISM="Neobodo designis, Strain CCAP 1951/1" /LENGTH=111 /DNA_ID=CAMNT_0016086943 /DNA_START=61 /DNA_END=393 /DNA_ORIENTATION=+
MQPMGDGAGPAPTPTRAPTTAANSSSAFYVFEAVCVLLLIASGLALRARRAQLLWKQQQRYQRLAQYSTAHGSGASGSVPAGATAVPVVSTSTPATPAASGAAKHGDDRPT